MITVLHNPAFPAYALATLVLCLNLMGLWVYSGAVRSRSGVAVNPEDSERFGAKLADGDPPAVARVLRAHRNAEATIYPFLLLGLVYMLAGGSAATAQILFSLFTASRLMHSWAYIGGKQPWRSLSFGLSAVCIFALMIGVAWLLLYPPVVTAG